jgi:predicted phosphoribosyltransferase
MFQDRKEAGQKLARALEKYKSKKALVLAIPRGGVQVGYEVARHLNADFSMLISRKLPFPDNPEAGFGAIAEDGSAFIMKEAAQWLPEKTIAQIKEEQLAEIKRRIKVLRENRPLQKISGRIVILIDDGLAMGSTMQASIMLCRKKKAKKIVVAVPVAGKAAADEIKKQADEVIVLEQPEHFEAVAQVYRNWYDVSDEEVLGIIKTWKKSKLLNN